MRKSFAHNTVHDAAKLAKFPNQVNTSKGKLLKCFAKGLILVKAKKSISFQIVTSEDIKQRGHDHDYALNDHDYALNDHDYALNDHDYALNDHDYALNAASANLLEHMKTCAAKSFHDVVYQYLSWHQMKGFTLFIYSLQSALV